VSLSAPHPVCQWLVWLRPRVGARLRASGLLSGHRALLRRRRASRAPRFTASLSREADLVRVAFNGIMHPFCKYLENFRGGIPSNRWILEHAYDRQFCLL
jgi:hypothetical protein